ncbi:unnamed protein product [Arctogadus glacialis]
MDTAARRRLSACLLVLQLAYPHHPDPHLLHPHLQHHPSNPISTTSTSSTTTSTPSTPISTTSTPISSTPTSTPTSYTPTFSMGSWRSLQVEQ